MNRRKTNGSVVASFSVPLAVRKRMLSFQRRHCVNWSAVFTAAVTKHMDVTEPQRRKSNGNRQRQ